MTEQRARELLAAEYERDGEFSLAAWVRKGNLGRPTHAVVRAITTALAESAKAPSDSVREALAELLPSRLCGENWDLPDTETVSITVTFGALARARAALQSSEADNG